MAEVKKAFPESFTVPPKQPDEKKPGQMSQAELEHFFEKGFVILKDVIDRDLLERLKKEWEENANKIINDLYEAGKITNQHEDKDFFHRLIHVDNEYPGKV